MATDVGDVASAVHEQVGPARDECRIGDPEVARVERPHGRPVRRGGRLLGRSLSTVERKLQVIRALWRGAGGDVP